MIPVVYDYDLMNRSDWIMDFQHATKPVKETIADENTSKIKDLVQSVSVPSVGMNIARNEHSGRLEFDKVEYNTEVTITFLDTKDGIVEKWYYDWLNSFYDLRNRVYRFNGTTPTRNATLTFFESPRSVLNYVGNEVNTRLIDPLGEFVHKIDKDAEVSRFETKRPVREIKFQGMLPKVKDGYNVSYGENSVPTLSITFVCEEVINDTEAESRTLASK